MSTSAVRKQDGKWLRGHSGNPEGRKRGDGHSLAAAIRDVVDPREMAQIAWDLARGKCNTLGQASDGGWAPIVEPNTRLAALNWLSNNGFIKPVTVIESNGTPARAIDFTALGAEDQAVFERLISKAAGDEK